MAVVLWDLTCCTPTVAIRRNRNRDNDNDRGAASPENVERSKQTMRPWPLVCAEPGAPCRYPRRPGCHQARSLAEALLAYSPCARVAPCSSRLHMLALKRDSVPKVLLAHGQMHSQSSQQDVHMGSKILRDCFGSGECPMQTRKRVRVQAPKPQGRPLWRLTVRL